MALPATPIVKINLTQGASFGTVMVLGTGQLGLAELGTVVPTIVDVSASVLKISTRRERNLLQDKYTSATALFASTILQEIGILKTLHQFIIPTCNLYVRFKFKQLILEPLILYLLVTLQNTNTLFPPRRKRDLLILFVTMPLDCFLILTLQPLLALLLEKILALVLGVF